MSANLIAANEINPLKTWTQRALYLERTEDLLYMELDTAIHRRKEMADHPNASGHYGDLLREYGLARENAQMHLQTLELADFPYSPLIDQMVREVMR